ncbi:MAG: polyprenyl synthetase family protein [Lachnospiraceae bacterium]
MKMNSEVIMFKDDLQAEINVVETIIQKYMPKESTYQKTVVDAMNYTMSAGGKRIRPLLMKKTYEFFGGCEEYVEPFMAAIEMIHTYSLIHDDLPALDNDDYRRGQKTAHVVYGEAMAILAGDSMLNYAFETALKAFSFIVHDDNMTVTALQKELSTRIQIERALGVLAKNPGIYGMIGGQVADVELTGTRLSKEQLAFIYDNKTGALIEASVLIGALLAGVDDGIIDKLKKVAYNIGMAFQIQDDILDETATFEELGKPIHSDEKNEKVTYVTIHGLEKAKEEVARLSEEAIDILDELDGDDAFLKELVRYLIHRNN